MYKSIRIIYDSAIKGDVLKIVNKNGIDKCIEYPNLKGEWGTKLKHLDNHIWPGTDSALLIVEEAEKAKKLIDALRNYKENMEYEVPFFVIVVNVEEFI